MGTISAVLLIAIRVINQLTPNDFSLGLLLRSADYFAFGLGALASLLFLLLLFFREVPVSVKLRAFAAVVLPYIVLAALYVIAKSSAHAGF